MSFFKDILSEDNGAYSMARVITLLLVVAGVFIMIYALINRLSDYMNYGVITASSGSALKPISKLTER